MEDEFLVSYEAVTPGIPVLTRDKEQFGILEHVLEVPQLDLFDGIVVWVGGGAFTGRGDPEGTQQRPPGRGPGVRARVGLGGFAVRRR